MVEFPTEILLMPYTIVRFAQKLDIIDAHHRVCIFDEYTSAYTWERTLQCDESLAAMVLDQL